MKGYFFAVILVIAFSFNSCNDDDDVGGEPSIKFTDKFEMTEWKPQGQENECSYIRFESDYHNYIKHWTNSSRCGYVSKDCYIIIYDNDLIINLHQEITILVNTENYLKYDNELYAGFVIQTTISYKNGIMEMNTNHDGLKAQYYYEKSEIDLNTLKLCD